MDNQGSKTVDLAQYIKHKENLNNAKTRSCGPKKKKAIQRKKKKILQRRMAAFIAGLVVTCLVGTGFYKINQAKNSPEHQITSTIDTISEQEQKINDTISKLGDNIYKNLTKNIGSQVIATCKQGTGTGNFFYDFDGVKKEFDKVAVEKLQQYNMTQEEATLIWESLSEEEQAHITVHACCESVKNYDGGANNKSNFIYKVEGSEASFAYEQNSEEYLSQKEEKAKESSIKLAQTMITMKLGHSLNNQEQIQPNFSNNSSITDEEVQEYTENYSQGRSSR